MLDDDFYRSGRTQIHLTRINISQYESELLILLTL